MTHSWQQTLAGLYQPHNPALLAKQEREARGLRQSAFCYGEVTINSFYQSLKVVAPQKTDVFYDIGSGSGKAVLTTALGYPLKRAIGIEYLESLHQLSEHCRQQLFPHYPRAERAQFILADYRDQDITDGDIIFLNATCMSDSLWLPMLAQLNRLKPGSRVIISTKCLDKTRFTALAFRSDLMSWGYNTVNIYVKR